VWGGSRDDAYDSVSQGRTTFSPRNHHRVITKGGRQQMRMGGAIVYLGAALGTLYA
jgi:hypothetical protein